MEREIFAILRPRIGKWRIRMLSLMKFPKPRYSGRSCHYSEDVIEDIAGISNWDDPGFLQYWRTMDDRRFWEEYVLKEVDGRYLWLKG